MRGKSIILWDLDGTLTDPEEGITKAVQHSLRAFGIEIPDRRRLYPFIGPPLKDSYMREFAFTQEEADLAIAKYREYFSVTGLYENIPYDGIAQQLAVRFPEPSRQRTGCPKNRLNPVFGNILCQHL